MSVADLAVSDLLLRDRAYLEGTNRPLRLTSKVQAKLNHSKQILLQRRNSVPEIRFAQDLPIFSHINQIQELLKHEQVIIVAGETGSGKTTQLPIACLASGLGIAGGIAHTQPRRLAARSVSHRIAEQLNVELGKEVGYAVRFDERFSETTLVKVMTDGLLLAEINRDRQLRDYEVVIVDEAHERSLNIDFLLGYLHQLIQRRKELKVIITSATIDVESFASYFKGAPIVKVEGRSYPVEVEYRPPIDSIEESVYGCIEEIRGKEQSGPQDILMFLPTEQEILGWANRLRLRFGRGLEVLPLYARLPPRDQQRIFKPSDRQRILLSTNVAETSLTVPNIRYVIDTGTARISRYSSRSRVQRLPIESISQASANQRKGRCGRIAPGICYRLYEESKFDRSDLYTEPELLRTNLASVVLQIKYFRLGQIRSFPFIDPPNERAIEDAERLLDELDAMQDGKLTRIGKQMARLPIEPRYARVLIEASRRGALREILIIVAALSIQDPRFRPSNARDAADEAHQEFQHKKSDFMSLLILWHWAEKERQRLSSSNFRQLLERHFISIARYFEWRSLHRQLHGYCQQLKLVQNKKAASYKDIHLALLTGSLGLLGVKEKKNQYSGVRGIEFRIAPGTHLAKSSPKWLVSAEIVETQRVYARTVGTIERKWIEEVAASHISVSFYDPYWDEKRGEAMTLSRGTLMGLPIYEKRSRRLAPLNPSKARDLFVDKALVTPKHIRKWDFLRHNLQLVQELMTLQAKQRRLDVMVNQRSQVDFYLERLPEEIVNLVTFEKWLSHSTPGQIKSLYMSKNDLLRRSDENLSDEAYPSHFEFADVNWRLRYRFAPGDIADGVSVQVRRDQLPHLSKDAIGWLVPGRFAEKCTELIKGLPKSYRRRLVPVPTRVEELCDYLLRPSNFRRGNLLQVLTDTISNFYEVNVPATIWDEEHVSPHLRMNIQMLDRRNRVVDQSRDLAELRERNSVQLKDALEKEKPITEESLTHFPEAGLNRHQTLRGSKGDFLVFPSLVEDGEGVRIEFQSNEHEQAMRHERALSRLFLLAEKQSVRFLKREFQSEREISLKFASVAPAAQLFDSLAMASAREAFLNSGVDIWRKEAFDNLLSQNRGQLVEVGLRAIALCSQIVAERFETSLVIEGLTSEAFSVAKSDLQRQLKEVLPPDFMWETPFERLVDLPRYLQAMRYRASHLQGRVEKDAVLMGEACEREGRLRNLLSSEGPKSDLIEAKYILAEYRIGLFHQRLGTKEKVSQKRLDTLFEQLERRYANL